jgi:hypothetical protein
VRLGKKTGGVAPSKSRNFPIEIEKRRAAINFALATSSGEQPEVIEMKRIAFTKNGRRLILVHNDPSQPAKIRHRIFPIARPVAVVNRSDQELEAENYEQYMREYQVGRRMIYLSVSSRRSNEHPARQKPHHQIQKAALRRRVY